MDPHSLNPNQPSLIFRCSVTTILRRFRLLLSLSHGRTVSLEQDSQVTLSSLLVLPWIEVKAQPSAFADFGDDDDFFGSGFPPKTPSQQTPSAAPAASFFASPAPAPQPFAPSQPVNIAKPPIAPAASFFDSPLAMSPQTFSFGSPGVMTPASPGVMSPQVFSPAGQRANKPASPFFDSPGVMSPGVMSPEVFSPPFFDAPTPLTTLPPTKDFQEIPHPAPAQTPFADFTTSAPPADLMASATAGDDDFNFPLAPSANQPPLQAFHNFDQLKTSEPLAGSSSALFGSPIVGSPATDPFGFFSPSQSTPQPAVAVDFFPVAEPSKPFENGFPGAQDPPTVIQTQSELVFEPMHVFPVADPVAIQSFSMSDPIAQPVQQPIVFESMAFGQSTDFFPISTPVSNPPEPVLPVPAVTSVPQKHPGLI